VIQFETFLLSLHDNYHSLDQLVALLEEASGLWKTVKGLAEIRDLYQARHLCIGLCVEYDTAPNPERQFPSSSSPNLLSSSIRELISAPMRGSS
jgi:hypothetical protein